jgi:hypothetical protein
MVHNEHGKLKFKVGRDDFKLEGEGNEVNCSKRSKEENLSFDHIGAELLREIATNCIDKDRQIDCCLNDSGKVEEDLKVENQGFDFLSWSKRRNYP